MTERKTATKATEKPEETREDAHREPDPYEHPEEFPCVLMLASGERVGAPSIQSTHHWSKALECDVPVVGVHAR